MEDNIFSSSKTVTNNVKYSPNSHKMNQTFLKQYIRGVELNIALNNVFNFI